MANHPIVRLPFYGVGKGRVQSFTNGRDSITGRIQCQRDCMRGPAVLRRWGCSQRFANNVHGQIHNFIVVSAIMATNSRARYRRE